MLPQHGRSRSHSEMQLPLPSMHVFDSIHKDSPQRRHPSKSCNECKQQKLKCSAPIDHPNPCSRCRKFGLDCKVEDGFRRVSKRQRTESLRHENEILRQQLTARQPSVEQQHTPPSNSSASGHEPSNPTRSSMNADPAEPHPAPGPIRAPSPPGVSSPVYPTPDRLMPGGSSHDNAGSTFITRLAQPTTSTLPRTISGVKVEAHEVNEIFALYFMHYSKHLPILDPSTTPNGYFEESPLLFWAIIGVGARRYSSNPSLLNSIADHVLHLGWPPLHATSAIIPAIQGLLLLSYFPFPTDSTFKDNSYSLSGTAINMALQVGLHAPLHSQDFYRSRFVVTDGEFARRVQLWFYCIVVHQKAACGLGYPIMVSPDRLKQQMDIRGLSNLVPASLQLETKLGSILGQVNPLLSPVHFFGEEANARFARKMMADVFEKQLDGLEAGSDLTELDRLYIMIARLQLRVNYLRDCEDDASLAVAKLGLCASAVIDMAERLDMIINIASYCPHYIFRMIALSASVLLRLLKTTRDGERREGGNSEYRSHFFTAISLLRKMSIDDIDGPSRMAKILSRLWSSERAFKRKVLPGGKQQVSPFCLGVQSRLSMSILHDTTWWYREEFGSISARAPPAPKASARAPPSHHATPRQPMPPLLPHPDHTHLNKTHPAAPHLPPHPPPPIKSGSGSGSGSGDSASSPHSTTSASALSASAVPPLHARGGSGGGPLAHQPQQPWTPTGLPPLSNIHPPPPPPPGALPMTDPALVFSPMFWDGQPDPEFDAMISEFPEAWPL